MKVRNTRSLKASRCRNLAFQRFVSVALALLLCISILGSCDKSPLKTEESDDENSVDIAPFDNKAEFDKLLNELFIKYVTCDSITLNYSIADPGSFGIEKLDPPTFGEVTSADTIRKDIEENRELREKISSFVYEELREDQQIIYDMLMQDIAITEEYNSNEDYSYYLGVFYPISGIHIELPILMAEFNFYQDDDIDIYLGLLGDLRRFFDELIEFERERSRRGFFMSDANVDEVIAHCESFIEKPEENIMVVVFEDKIDLYEGLSDEQREQYKRRNRELFYSAVLPAYETLIEAMQALRGVGSNTGGLSSLPDGEAFSRIYLRLRSGSDIDPNRIESMLTDSMNDASATIGALINEYPNLLQGFSQGTLGNIRNASPEKYLIMLQKAIVNDFPEMDPVQYDVREVNESMQDFMSPAFYMIPALDHYKKNTIYINPSSNAKGLGLLTTLAHEGFPGHLYQTVYYLQHSPHPIRTVMSYTGYIEGWATYAEYRSYLYAGLDEPEATIMSCSNLFDLLFVTRIDLGVNVLGWGMDEAVSFCQQFGLYDLGVVDEIYQSLIGYPLQYMPYAVGYMEFTMMREKAEDTLRESFDATEFHRFILDFGPASFSLLNRHFQDWLAAQPRESLAPAA